MCPCQKRWYVQDGFFAELKERCVRIVTPTQDTMKKIFALPSLSLKMGIGFAALSVLRLKMKLMVCPDWMHCKRTAQVCEHKKPHKEVKIPFQDGKIRCDATFGPCKPCIEVEVEDEEDGM